MVGNLNSVTTTVPARTPAPPVARPMPEPSAQAAVAASGNKVAASGENLPPAQPAKPPPEPVVDVDRAIARLNELMSGNRRSLRFQVDHDSGRTVITVINPKTKEVIRQIPPEELLNITRSLEELGSLIDARA